MFIVTANPEEICSKYPSANQCKRQLKKKKQQQQQNTLLQRFSLLNIDHVKSVWYKLQTAGHGYYALPFTMINLEIGKETDEVVFSYSLDLAWGSSLDH